MKSINKNKRRMSSITQKYSRGFYLILMMNVLVFFLSFFSSEYIARQYEQSMTELLEINELFVDIEDTNSALYNYKLFQEEDSRENYVTASARITESIDELRMHMDKVYSRNIVDLCYMAEIFQDKGDKLIDNIYAVKHILREGNSSDLLSIQFEETQDVISYINKSFKNIYTEKLASTQDIEERLKKTRKNLNAVSILILLFSFLICINYHHRIKEEISCSIHKLTDFALNITKTKSYTSKPIILHTNDEISLFADAFNNMLLTIKEQIQKIKENAKIKEQLQRVEMENLRISSKLQSSKLNLLQSRINPHFLFNTLNMISRTAYIENAEETAKLIEATADFLRYNLGKLTKSVTLAQELENVKDYTYIQQCRFRNRIEFIFSIDGCESYKIPCMILQPLVENAIIHGVGNMLNGGKIITRVYREDGRIYLEVEDNGLGITEEKRIMLEQVLQNSNQMNEHIGINNVYQRLKLFFNNDVKFLIFSDENKTLMQISIPPVEDNKSVWGIERV